MKKFFLSGILITSVILWMTSILFSQEDVELKFSHQLHVAEQGMDCQTCHEGAETSQTGLDNLMPPMELCGQCHDIEDDENCVLCHSDMDNPRAVPRVDTYSQKFSHEQHLQANLDCASCHSDVKEKTVAEPYILPTMVECMDCHQSRGVSNACSSCHLPSDRLMPASHTINFIHTHSDLAQTAREAMTTGKDCAVCHQQNFCQRCHEGDNLDRKTHPLNYEFTHSLDAQGQERECAACHTERQFCIDCHNARQVLPRDHRIGWANNVDGGQHRISALNDLESCMACHEQNAQQTCQPCHGSINR